MAELKVAIALTGLVGKSRLKSECNCWLAVCPLVE